MENDMTSQQLSDLMASMSLDEKLAQMTQLAPICLGFSCITPFTGPDPGLRVSSEHAASVGSILNCDSAASMRAVQEAHLAQDPHRIPLLFMADIIHGFKTIFPIPLAMGCSFSPSDVEEACRIAAAESSASGIHVTFSPMADLVRDPRWGRVMESFGEDPVLNSRLCAAAVQGYQGSDPSAPGRVASCVKHFAAYGAPEGGREYNTVDLSYGVLRETYLPAYQAAVDAGAKLVMSSFNTVDRRPATASKALLTDILREEWGFDGAVISDYNSVGELNSHGIADGPEQAAAQSLLAGVDIEMMSTCYLDTLKASLEKGLVSMSMVDNAVMRILRLKNDLGLFERPCGFASPEAEKNCHLSEAHRQAARRIAGESIVLLKNETALPLTASAKPIGLTGPFACSTKVLGGWSAGNTDGVSLLGGLRSRRPAPHIHMEGCEELGSLLDGVKDIPPVPGDFADRFGDCETVIAAVGENQNDTGEGASKAFLRLSPNQELLIQILAKAGKKVIAVIFSGRPLEIAPILPCCDAVIQAWFPGTESGNALADILYGDRNPSARLSMSFPYTAGQIPVYYNHFQTGRPETDPSAKLRYVSRYLDCPSEPLFCFGYGLSYSSFDYSPMVLTSTRKGLEVSVEIRNTSDRDGTETVQLYIRGTSGKVVRPVKELKDFKKVLVPGGGLQTVRFRITKDMLSCQTTGLREFEPGNYEIMVGRNASDTQSQTIYIGETDYKEVL